ncbi:MAG: ABC transporter permease, partial [Actinomycetota bacterium]|nr:ABC transporter permease [Actinomycetota bacterium]
MAESSVARPVPHGSALAPYRAVLASRIRSQAGYRTSFGLDLGSSVLVGLTELAEVAVLFTSVSAIGGFDRAA